MITSLEWKGKFRYPGMLRIPATGDGSCFFHSVVQAFYVPYQTGLIDGKPLNRSAFVRNFRRELAEKLEHEYYHLSRGELENFSREMPDFSLENMKRLLDSDLAVDNRFNELVSNILDKDIYLLDAEKEDVYFTGKDVDILYRNRESIVILVLPGHYDLVGISTSLGIQTTFSPTDPFILAIHQRISESNRGI